MAIAVDTAKATGNGTGPPRGDEREIDWVGYLFIAFFALPFVVFNIMPVFFGAYVAFTLARSFGRPFVDRMVARRDWRRADEMLTRHGTAAVFVGRFFPVISFNLINWAAGLTGMSLWTFTWATGLGILPVTGLMVFLGDRMETIPWWGWVLLLLGAFATIPLGRWLYRLHSR